MGRHTERVADIEQATAIRGFIVHAWSKANQVRLAGRLENGQSFAVMASAPAAGLLVSRTEAQRAVQLLSARNFPAAPAGEDKGFPQETFDGKPLTAFPLESGAWRPAADLLSNAGIGVYGDPPRSAEDYLTLRGIRGLAALIGEPGPGKRVARVYQDPTLSAATGAIIPLLWLALDIETSREGTVRAISLVARPWGFESPPASALEAPPDDSFLVAEVLFRGPAGIDPAVRCFATEAGLLAAFLERVQAIDPDVLTGWNVIDFDLDLLCRRCAAHGLPFLLGRSDEPARVEKRPGQRTRTFIPGRQAVDAMQLFRGSETRFEDQTLDTVAANLLGRGKTVHARGEDKMAELDRLYSQEPAAFCHYCLEDSRLVILILEKTGLHHLTQNRAALTGVGLDLAWTSIPTFERIYALELASRRILPPAKDPRRTVSGAAGGMVLNPRAGLFSNVLLLDFRSLYPSIMRSFGIDPLSHERCRSQPQPSDIVAPNGARFRRGAGILPELIGSYFAERSQAQAAGDETGAYVYKILMNSFYGVLGSPGCRYGRSELAGAITSFGRFWLEFSRDWFEAAGYRVLYGDTDSVFVATGLDDSHDLAELTELGATLAVDLNNCITAEIRDKFDLHSWLAIRSEKVFRRFLIPRMRSASKLAANSDTDRGRAKGYAGLVPDLDGASHVEVKGMEAARSDWTPLARRFQMELLDLVFADKPAAQIKGFLENMAAGLRSGKLDPELVYRKQLRRNAQDYTAMETPQVRAARILGWTNQRGTIEYLMTTAGAEPVGQVSHEIDYEHYIDHQLLPIWDSIADAAGLADTGRFNRQTEFEWGNEGN